MKGKFTGLNSYEAETKHRVAKGLCLEQFFGQVSNKSFTVVRIGFIERDLR